LLANRLDNFTIFILVEVGFFITIERAVGA
jgi:hypothetical protein